MESRAKIEQREQKSVSDCRPAELNSIQQCPPPPYSLVELYPNAPVSDDGLRNTGTAEPTLLSTQAPSQSNATAPAPLFPGLFGGNQTTNNGTQRRPNVDHSLVDNSSTTSVQKTSSFPSATDMKSASVTSSSVRVSPAAQPQQKFKPGTIFSQPRSTTLPDSGTAGTAASRASSVAGTPPASMSFRMPKFGFGGRGKQLAERAASSTAGTDQK